MDDKLSHRQSLNGKGVTLTVFCQALEGLIQVVFKNGAHKLQKATLVFKKAGALVYVVRVVDDHVVANSIQRIILENGTQI